MKFFWTTKTMKPLYSLLKRYDNSLKNLEETINTCSCRHIKIGDQIQELLLEKILEVVIIRDALQKELEITEASPGNLLQVSKLDRKLSANLSKLAKNKYITWSVRRYLLTQLEAIRNVSNPAAKSWWWFLNIPVHGWDRWDFTWNTLTFIWLVSIFSLFTDIASRFLTGGAGLGIEGSFAVICQSILVLASGGSLTTTGQKVVENTLKKWKIPKNWWQETKFVAASLLLVFFILFRSYLPEIAHVYNNEGRKDYENGHLDSAESKYKRAIELTPDYEVAHYNLGELYEDLQDFKQAQQHYNLSVQIGFPPAINNLARLYILSEKVPVRNAVNLLKKGISQLENELQFSEIQGKEQIQYSLFKNLGWARLKQERYQEAKDALKIAINIEPKNASAYCLLSQVLEKLDSKQKDLEDLKEVLFNCINSQTNPNNPEEDEWVYQAQQNMDALTSNSSN